MKNNIVVLAIVLAAGFIACEKKAAGGAPAAALSGVTFTVGDIQWKEDQVLFDAAGVGDTPYKLNITVFEGGNTSVEAVSAGQIDITRISEIPPLFAAQAEKGPNFTIVALLHDHITTANQEIIVLPESGITTIAALKGKKVGYVKATTAHYFLYKFLEDAGLGFNDITPVEVTPSDGPAALLAKSIDAYAGFGGAVNAAKEKGAVTLAFGADKLSGYFPYVVPKAILSDSGKRAALFDFLGRMNAAYSWIAANPAAWAKLSASNTGLNEQSALAQIQSGISRLTSSVIAPSEATRASMQDIAGLFYRIGLIGKQVDVQTLYTTEYNAELEVAIARYAK
ncbi:MAG: ABC transporter substrate-binding protein [Spirochaetaceae bacterium]|jgi:sulfonate transport system substrate-binding protein|nr:ABC transporter substrate-binding protein [Spirochaetaceae bacterium]